MPESFDPYYQWLGIRDPARPPSHYRLLGVETYESNLEVIATAADRQMAHLRTYQHGKNVELSERLLNEVSAAKVCLLDREKKAEYDRALRESQSPDAPPLVPPELDSDEDSGQPEIVVPEQERGPLNRPGRSNRRLARRRNLPTIVLVASILVLAVVAVFRLIVNPDETIVVAPADPPTVEESKVDSTGESSVDPSEDDSAQNPDAEVAPSDTDDESTRPAADQAVQADVEPPDVDDVASGEPWIPKATNSGPRPQFSASDPFEAVLLALSNRNLSAASSLLNNARPGDTSRDKQKYDQAKLLIYNMGRFWQSIEQSKSSLQRGSQLFYQGESVSVANIDSRQMTLSNADGLTKTFDLRMTELEPDLARSLIDHRFQQAVPVGWRLLGNFLLIDKLGDVDKGREYLRRAENHGFDADFLARAIDMITGKDNGQIVSVPTNDDATSGGDDGDQAQDRRIAVPSSAEQVSTRQELKKAGLLDATAPRCLELARSEEERAIAQFVLLKEAARLSLVNHDVESGLASVELLSDRFQVDRADLQFDFLQRLSRSSKRDERADLVDAALQISGNAVLMDDYDQANRFADLAMSIGRSSRDEAMRSRLTQTRERIKQIEREYESSRDAGVRLEQNADDPASNTVIGEFLCFAKGDFANGLQHLKVGEDAALRKIASADLANPRNSSERKKVGSGWRSHARQVKGLHQLHSLDRARHWYELSLIGAPVAEATQTRQTLNEISEAIGQHEGVLDVTVLHPNASKTGYGGLGINQNRVVNNGRIRELPRIQGREISRFLWAHAPSMIEYDVPKGAKAFSAIGMLNANSTDGAEFFVQVDGKTWFSSGVLQTRGQSVAIAVRLPDSAQKIVLNVDSKNAVQDDQTYWVNPVFTF